ncbi:DNA-binding transcriptional regulator YiaG [Rhodoblastus sphagnicola]|nr:helix-turn-helix domain-containing protein [Rhodoblastus sphagnicola]MBB4201147.1 DNA-binding transcriptional regulator YiaG [Rhodoblastus sphagnicola]
MNIRHFAIKGEAFCKEPLHYTDCGLDNIYLRNGFSLDADEEDQYLTVADIDGLHRAIGMNIVLTRKAPSGKELRFLRHELKMSQAELATVLSVSDQSVARWEKGQCEANGAAVFALRIIYLLSLVPDDERTSLLDGILERLKRLSEEDETTDDIVLSYVGKKWQAPTMAA